MSGDSQREDDSDFLDDDFIVEDIAAKNEDLDRLFDMPAQPADPSVAAKAGSPTSAENQTAEVLFRDHTKGLDPSTRFEGGPEFAEAGASTWNGEALELEPNGGAKAAGAGASKPKPSEDEPDEEFELDSDSTLEVVGAAEPNDGVQQFEQSGPFTLDDGDETIGEAEQATEAIGELRTAAGDAAEEESEAPGWEPLPSADMDALAEVPELARADDGDAEPEAELVEAGVGSGPAAAADESELEHRAIRPTQPAMTHVRAPRGRGRTGRLLVSLAASFMVLGAGAVVVFRPELVGLRLEPQRVEQAQLERPTIALEVPPPALPNGLSDPVAVSPLPTLPTGEPPVPPEVVPPGGQTPPPVVPPAEPPPVVPVGNVPKPESPTEVPVVVGPPNPEPLTDVPAVPVATGPTPDSGPWPVPVRGADPNAPRASAPAGLIRVSDELKIGEQTIETPRPVNAVEGVSPGSRAFAQLHNGNYFIGSVKNADAQRVTLKLEDGEITLPLSGIARLTELGSADYAELQKVTSGFVRLTNNNRLVGGILSNIADDYVVLEVRRNRVMLPRSAIGAFVQGDDDQAVRLDTTVEEDNWLRKLAERQLGTGQPVLLPVTPPGPGPTPVAPHPR